MGSWSALAVLMAGTFMIVLDFFIVNVALPAMQADLQASASAIEWVVAGYGLVASPDGYRTEISWPIKQPAA